MKRMLIIFLLITLFISGCMEKQQASAEKAVLSFILGEVMVDGNPAALNQEIRNEMVITTGEKSRAEVRMGKASGVQVRENTQVKLVIDQNQWKTELAQGAVLNLLRPGSKYQLSGPASVIAVRGTIFYVNCYEDGKQYVCTCNGTIDISIEEISLKEVTASHHEPYTIVSTAHGIVLKPTEMKEHNDLEIFEFMYRIERQSE